MFNVAAIVIFYYPESCVFANLTSYIEQVGKIFVIDNSDGNINNSLISKIHSLTNVEYIWNQSNLGIAAALNIGAQKAIEQGFEFILTMDQDSRASERMVEKLMEVMLSNDKIGIVAAEHLNLETHSLPKEESTQEILYTMTSGNMVNLAAYKKIGGFREDLFIDHVDHEFCLRLHQNSFKVFKTNNALVYHKLGKSLKKKFFNYYFFPSNHPPIRLYYRTRNRFLVDNIYKKIMPDYVKEDRRNMLYELFGIFIYENNRIDKIKMMIKGYFDYRKNRMGKYKGDTTNK